MKKLFSILLCLIALTCFSQPTHTTHNIGIPLVPGIGITFNNGLVQADTIIIINTTIAQLRAVTTVSKSTTGYWFHTTDIDGYWFYSPTDTRTDNTATVLVSSGGQHFNRAYQGQVHDVWWGIKHDGVTPSKTQLRNMFSTCSNLGEIIMDNGSVMVGDTMSIPFMQHVTFTGSTWDSSKFINNGSNPGLFYPQGGVDVHWKNMFLYCGTSHSALDFGDGLIYSIGYSFVNYDFQDVQFSCPNANMTALNLLVQNAPSGFPTGHLEGVRVIHCYFNGEGQACVSMMNRDTLSAHHKDSLINCSVKDCIFKHTGLLGSYGFAVTWDGVGRSVNFTNNYLNDMFGVAIENTGFDFSYFTHNTIENCPRGATFFGFSTRNMFNCTVAYNYCADTMTSGSAFIQCFNFTFEGNVFKVKGANYTGFRNSSNNVLINETYVSQYIYAFQLQATVNNTCVGNRFINCTFDNSASTSNFAAISFDGRGCGGNILDRPVINKGTGGGNWGLSDTAAYTNMIYNANVAGNALFCSYHAVTIPNVKTDTLASADDLANFAVMQFTGGDSAGIDTVWFQSLIHFDFKFQNRMVTPTCIGLLSSHACAVVYPNQYANIVCDGVNIRTYNINTGVKNAVNGVNPMSFGAGSIYVSNNQLVYPEDPTTPNGATTRAIDSGTFYGSALNSLIYSLTSKTQVLNSTAVTSIIGVGHNTPVLPAHWVTYRGRTFDVDGWGFLTMGSTASYGTLSYYVGNIGDSVQFVCPINLSPSGPVEFHIRGVSRGADSTAATISMTGKVIVNGVSYPFRNTADYSMNTNIPDTLNMLWTFSAANASNAYTLYNLTLKIQ